MTETCSFNGPKLDKVFVVIVAFPWQWQKMLSCSNKFYKLWHATGGTIVLVLV